MRAEDNRERGLLNFILAVAKQGRSVAVVSHVDESLAIRKVAIDETGTVEGELDFVPAGKFLGIIQAAMAGSDSVVVLDRFDGYVGLRPIVVEIIRPKPSLVIFGAGHVGQAVALMGAMLGYNILVIDDREEFLCRARFPDERIRTLASSFDRAVGEVSLNRGSAAIIVTRGHQFDEVCLRGVAESTAAYIGMIGSKRRVISVFKKLIEDGVSPETLERVHAPIGLRIGARTPQEIAIAIIAEVIQTLNAPQAA